MRLSWFEEGMAMADERGDRSLSTTYDAPWLPPASAAEVWVGEDCGRFEPAVIVRLLVTREGAAGTELFTEPAAKGHDLPTLFLGPPDRRLGWREGLDRLVAQTLARSTVPVRCVGYVRNVVPMPDPGYPHPRPHAHVPVFRVDAPVEPVVIGQWFTLEAGRELLQGRHWWPIVEHELSPGREGRV